MKDGIISHEQADDRMGQMTVYSNAKIVIDVVCVKNTIAVSVELQQPLFSQRERSCARVP
jgi:hypothetical protein